MKKSLGILGIALTILKPLWGPALTHLTDNAFYFMAGMTVFVCCDIFDGVLYRRSGSGLKLNFFGKYRQQIDVVGDKIVVYYCAYYFVIYLDFPIYVLLALKLRDLLVAYFFITHHRMQTNNWMRGAVAACATIPVVWLLASETQPPLRSLFLVYILACVYGMSYWGICKNTLAKKMDAQKLLASSSQKLIVEKADPEVKKAHDAVRSLYFFTTPAYWLVWSSWKNLGAMHMGYYDNSATNHDAAVLRLVDKVTELIGVNGNDNILDAGCGNGCALIRLYQKYRCKGVGVNIVPLHVWIARVLAFFHGASLGVKFQTADFAETPFTEGSFSVVWFMESLCHAPDKIAALKEAWRVLQSGGRIAICDGVSRHDPPLNDEETQYIKVWWDGHAVPSLPSSVEYEEVLKQIGFTRIEMHDFTPQVQPSLERLGKISRRSLEKVTGCINRWRMANKIASVRMAETFEKGLWQYMLITAQKP